MSKWPGPSKQVGIRPVWTFVHPDGAALSSRLIELLVRVHAEGSLMRAAKSVGLSYRHAWDLVRQGEERFGVPLMRMERGKGSSLTELGEKIAWADHRIHARLQPVLDSLASEIEGEMRSALSQSTVGLRLHASHGFAIERLVALLADSGVHVDLTYGSSMAAAAALHGRACDAAGFHIPIGALQEPVLAHYTRWLARVDLTLIDLAVRRQGLLVRAGNPKEVHALEDLTRSGITFINRQPGSGTRLLLDGLLRERGIDAARIAGFEQIELTHAAVAAYVASGMADVGFGLELPARRFKLDFVPLAFERYFLLCRTDAFDTPLLRQLRDALGSPELRAALQTLPGYDVTHLGRAQPLHEVYPALGAARA